MAILNFYQLLFYFFIYAFLGWCTEVIFCSINTKAFVNRGFLNGPVCPIYGFGVTGVVLALTPFKDNLLILFAGSVVLTSALEFITGYLLEKIFHTQWWDYSEENFNLGGYICLKFSLIWGFACLIVVNMVHPLVAKITSALPTKIGWVILSIFIIAFVADGIATVVSVAHLKKNLGLSMRMAQEMRELSDKIGLQLSNSALNAVKKNKEHAKDFAAWKEKMQSYTKREVSPELLEFAQNFKEKSEKYISLLEEKHLFSNHIVKAFPNVAKKVKTDTLLEEKHDQK